MEVGGLVQVFRWFDDEKLSDPAARVGLALRRGSQKHMVKEREASTAASPQEA